MLSGQLHNMRGHPGGPGPNTMLGTVPGPQGMMSPGHLQNMRGHPARSPDPQGMVGPAPNPQGVLSPGHAAGPHRMLGHDPGPQRGPLSSPQGRGVQAPHGLAPMNGGMQAPVPYVGYYPAHYFGGQSAGQNQQILHNRFHALMEACRIRRFHMQRSL